ncbi:MAG TPA: DUF2442 domain-containing protein [Bacillota bacterium]
MFHKVIQVYPTEDYRVYLYFTDGKVKLFDAKELVIQGIFQQLKDAVIFRETCTVLNDTLAWDLSGKRDPSECLDLDPEELYETCPEVEEPPINTALN